MNIASAIESASKKYNLPPEIIYGVCVQESALNPFAVRFEPHYKWIVKDRRLKPKGCSDATEITLQKTSFGLMQVMGAVIREQGFAGWLTETLCSVEMQIEFGCRHLAKGVKRWGSIEAGLSAYNAGSPRKENGRYVNQNYVDGVLRHSRGWSHAER
jgi:soluble lytic murein transglycosylase-like protein